MEFSVGEALENNCDYLITCGGIQSNHARATAAVAAKLGLGSYLVLRGGDENEEVEGNLFLDKLLGANIKFVTSEEYKNRAKIMDEIRMQLAKKRA